MAISRSLRFEVLRRDGFACSYCGRKPPEVELHIDHVTPTALGGRDVPENLATSCADCNLGKGSTPPDAETVSQVSDDAERWAAAIVRAADEMVAEVRSTDWFVNLWISVLDASLLPLDVQQHLIRIERSGLPREVITEMFWVAVSARIPDHARFRYFVGCCNRRIDQMHARAAELVAEVDGQ